MDTQETPARQFPTLREVLTTLPPPPGLKMIGKWRMRTLLPPDSPQMRKLRREYMSRKPAHTCSCQGCVQLRGRKGAF